MQVTVEKIVEGNRVSVEIDHRTEDMFWMLRTMVEAGKNFLMLHTVCLHTSETYNVASTDMLVGQVVINHSMQVSDVLMGVLDTRSLIDKLAKGGNVKVLSTMLTEYFKNTAPGDYVVTTSSDGYEEDCFHVVIPAGGPQVPYVRWLNTVTGCPHYFRV